jgi:hypothetical protein
MQRSYRPMRLQGHLTGVRSVPTIGGLEVENYGAFV